MLSLPRRDRLDGKRVNPIVHQIPKRGVDCALAGDSAHADEGLGLDGQREVAFAAAVVAGVADVVGALIVEFEPCRSKRGDEALPDLGGDRRLGRSWGGGDAVHLFYIEA